MKSKNILKNKVNNLTIFFVIAVFFLLPVGRYATLMAKDTGENPPSITWIQEFPGDEGKGGKGFLTKVSNILFGKRAPLLSHPMDLVVDSQKIIVLDQGNYTPIFIDSRSGKIKVMKKKDSEIFPSLVSICRGGNRKVYFTDSKLNKIFVLDYASKRADVLNNSLKLNRPTGIAYSRVNDELWVSETGEHRLLILDTNGNIKKVVGSRGIEEGQFNFPTFIWIDRAGYAYVIDSLNFRVQIFDPHGRFVRMFGEAGDGTGYFARPKGVATDSFGNIYIVDTLFNAVQIFDQYGNFLYSFGSQGSGQGEFWMPTGIYIDDKNHIYVADSYNSRIQVFQLLEGGNVKD